MTKDATPPTANDPDHVDLWDIDVSALPDTSGPQPEPSDLVKASPFLMDCLKHGLPLAEIERRARRAQHLAEVYSSIPFYAQRAARDPDYWNRLYVSRVNW